MLEVLTATRWSSSTGHDLMVATVGRRAAGRGYGDKERCLTVCDVPTAGEDGASLSVDGAGTAMVAVKFRHLAGVWSPAAATGVRV